MILYSSAKLRKRVNMQAYMYSKHLTHLVSQSASRVAHSGNKKGERLTNDYLRNVRSIQADGFE